MWTNNKEKKMNLIGLVFILLLAVGLVLLKVTGCISWSWLWIFSPIWIALLILVILGIGILIFSNEDDVKRN